MELISIMNIQNKLKLQIYLLELLAMGFHSVRVQHGKEREQY